jgi:hypothetical protein
VTPAEERLRDAFLQELWPTCREVPREERAEKRKTDRAFQRRMEEQEAFHRELSVSTAISTGCAETGREKGHPPPTGPVEMVRKWLRRHESTPGSVVGATDESRGLAS